MQSHAAVPLKSSEAVKPYFRSSGWNACFGEHSTESIWFPPFNQVTQAWNAQPCQTARWGGLRNNGPVRATDAEGGRGFLSLCAEWQP